MAGLSINLGEKKDLKVTDIAPDLFEKGIVNSKDYLALMIDNFLSKEECNDLIQQTESMGGYEQALLNVGGGAQKLNTKVRNSDRCIIDDTNLAAAFYERAKDFVPETFETGWTKVGLNERLRFLRYDKGCYFKPHFDGSYIRPDGQEKSFITFFLFLNDGFKGGHSTFINLGSKQHVYPCKPKPGRLIIFQQEGRKYAIRTDFMYRKV